MALVLACLVPAMLSSCASRGRTRPETEFVAPDKIDRVPNARLDTDKAVGQLFSADFVASGSVVKTDSGWLVAYTLASADDGHIDASDFSVAQDHAAIMSEAGRFAESLDGLASRSQE